MPKSLIVVESPAKARTLSKYLGRNFLVRATIGHIKDLPQSSLGVNVEKDFAPSVRIMRGKLKVVQALRLAAGQVDSIYLASDPDREGEAIAWHVVEEINKGLKEEKRPTIYRVLLHEITRSGVMKALDSPGVLDRERYESQIARRILDRLVGYELSPLLWRKVGAGLSAGRVQSVAVALVVDREREILAFVPEEYWNITARLDGANPPTFPAKLVRIKGDKAKVSNEETAKPLIEALRKARYEVTKIQRDVKNRHPSPPFITSTLQQDAHRLLRFSTKKTMSLAQRLYEGVDMGDLGTHGLITYMRTDSTRVSGEALDAVRAFVEQEYGRDYVPAKPRTYKNRKSSQDAHEAIRPTSMDFRPESVTPYLDRDMARLYDLVWNRFVASQMASARFDVTVVSILADESWEFEATGEVLLFDGFLRVGRDTSNGGKNDLPILAEGEVLNLLSLDGEQHFTQPPPRFTEGTLVKEMERKGIGRPSTYATILSTIQDKRYVEKGRGKFMPTDLGMVVTDLLRENFPNIMGVGFTAQMEEELDRIEEGQSDRLKVLTSFWTGFKSSLDEAAVKMRNVKREPIQTDVECPTCKAGMVIRFGKKGAFLACSTFPTCRTTLPFKRDELGKVVAVEEIVTQETCETCSSPLVLRDGRFGRFWACSAYPKCRFTKPFSTGFPCPEADCSGTLVEKKSRKNRVFYRCSRHPECQFVSFSRLRGVPCPACANPFMEEKGRGKDRTYVCPKCKHSMQTEEDFGAREYES